MISPQKNILDPDAMHAALEAFNLAWAEIDVVTDAYDPNLARNVLSKRIMKAALERGERNPERLKAYALKAFKEPSR